jgi:hypothetical protein
VPVWFSLVDEPAGHVALLAPDGSVYSTSDLGNVPHHHPNLDELISYYAYYGLTLTYLGWTEDIENVAVVAGSLAYAGGTTTPQEDELSAEQIDALHEAIQKDIAFVYDRIRNELLPGSQYWKDLIGGVDKINTKTEDLPEKIWTHLIDHRNPATGELEKDVTTAETVLSFMDANFSRQSPAEIALKIDAAGVAAEVRDELIKLIGGK